MTRINGTAQAAKRPPPLRLRVQEVPESVVLDAALKVAGLHPGVAWACRMNSGATRYKDANGKERFVRFHTMPGMSDIVGQMKDGRFLAMECKRRGEYPTEAQQRFLELVRDAGGVAGVVRSAQDAADLLSVA